MTHDDLHTFDRFQRISKTGAGVEFQVAGVQPGFDAQGGVVTLLYRGGGRARHVRFEQVPTFFKTAQRIETRP